VNRTLANGAVVPAIDDITCAGCHQGSNRTVLQYWGIRLDQNADVVNNRQYPANPVARRGTQNDTRLYDPAVGNHTFNGRNANQYLEFEDYDGDGRDDTPADIHQEKGLGCIDCHGSYDIHGGDATAGGTEISSRMEQQVAIRCENCHGTVDAYAATVSGTAYDGTSQTLAVDSAGKALRNVVKQSDGVFYLTSKLDGRVHYVPQTRDAVVNNGKVHPVSGAALYSAKASYAMGRVDGDPSNGIGPRQTAGVTPGFAHSDRMDCAACHSSWTNTCMGCHLSGEYDSGNNFSNQTGERIVYKQRTADFTYQSPLFFQLGVSARGRISTYAANTKVMYQWQDQNGQLSRFFQFSDRHAAGNNAQTTLDPVAVAQRLHGALDPRQGGRDARGSALLQHLSPDAERPLQLRHPVRGLPHGDEHGRLRRARLQPPAPALRAESGQHARLALLPAHGGRPGHGPVPVRPERSAREPARQLRRAQGRGWDRTGLDLRCPAA
jgi:hypothetical protein